MKKVNVALLALLLLLASCTGGNKKGETAYKLSEADRQEIMDTFIETQDAWNAGNLEEFMKGYWQSEKLVFAGVSGPTYGYDKTLERYKVGYPDTEAMGMLKFKVMDLYQVDSRTALMVGQFYLSRSIGDVIGYYTLVWQNIDGRWVIISDHSSGRLIQE